MTALIVGRILTRKTVQCSQPERQREMSSQRVEAEMLSLKREIMSLKEKIMEMGAVKKGSKYHRKKR